MNFKGFFTALLGKDVDTSTMSEAELADEATAKIAALGTIEKRLNALENAKVNDEVAGMASSIESLTDKLTELKTAQEGLTEKQTIIATELESVKTDIADLKGNEKPQTPESDQGTLYTLEQAAEKLAAEGKETKGINVTATPTELGI